MAFADSHTGVLRDPAVAERLVAVLEQVKPPFPEEHIRELLRGGYDLPAGMVGGYTPLEAYLVRTIGHYMDALVAGRLQPIHPVQEQFVGACRGERPVRQPVDSAWRKLNRDLPDRERE